MTGQPYRGATVVIVPPRETGGSPQLVVDMCAIVCLPATRLDRDGRPPANPPQAFFSADPGVCTLTIAEALVQLAAMVGRDHDPAKCGHCDDHRVFNGSQPASGPTTP